VTPAVAIVVFPGTNSEAETLDACIAAGMTARLFHWSEEPTLLRDFNAYVLPGGFAFEDRVRAGAIAAKTRAMDVIAAEAARGKLVLGICNGAQVLAERGLLGEVAIGRNLPARHFQCRFVDVVSGRRPQACAFTAGLQPQSVLRMAFAHGEGRFCGSAAYFDELEAQGRIVFRYRGPAPNGALHDAAAVCNERGNVLGLMPHPERAAWAFNLAFKKPALRGGDPNAPAGAHAIFVSMRSALEHPEKQNR
jgi:phosphoribosylformylglycinamidine synthase